MKPGAFVRYYRIPPFIRAIESIPPLPRAIKRTEVSTISFHPLSDSVQTVWKGRKLAFSVPGGGRRREVSQTHIYITRCISSGTVDGVVSWLMSARTELRSIHHPSRNSNESKRYRDTANRCNPTTSRTMLPSDRLRIECNLTEGEEGEGFKRKTLERIVNERREGRGSEGEREREGRRARGEMVSGACTAASSNRNPWRRSSRSATYPCTSIRRFCAAHLRLSGLSRRCPSRATACGCGLTAPIGMARIGYWRSSNGIEQGSGGKAGRGDKRERFL